jgi:hypothetical protein
MGKWYVLDANGNRKQSALGSAAGLTVPVSVLHGGTGLLTVAQGDLLYGSAPGVLARLAKDTGGLRILSNLGAGFNPVWSNPLSALSVVPRPTARKSGWHEALGTASFASVAATATTAGTTTAVTDAVAQWLRFTTGAISGNQAGHRSAADLMWLNHAPLFEAVVRPGSITACTIWVVLSNVGAALLTNNADQHLLKGVGFRFDSATDGGQWVPWTSDGTTQTIGTPIAAIAANGVYVLTCTVAAGGGSAALSVNGSAPQTVTIGAAALGTLMRLNGQITTTAAAAKILDITTIYQEWN